MDELDTKVKLNLFSIDLELNKAYLKPITIVSGSFLNAILEFSDDAGNILANMEKKTTCRDSIATVSLKIMTGMCINVS